MILLYLVLIVLLSIPIGFLIAWLARDELVQGRKYLLALSYACAFGSLFYFMVFGTDGNGIATGFSILCIGIIAYIGYMKSFDKRWTLTKRNV